MPSATALRTLLNAHKPVDATEHGHLQATLALLAQDAPFARTSFTPGHVTASAYVLDPSGGLLMIFHDKLQRLLQPGGHVEAEDDTVLAAAMREVTEETHITALEPVGQGLFDVDVHTIPARTKPAHKAEPAHDHHDVRFLFRTTQTEAAAGDGVSAARFVPPTAWDALCTDAGLTRVIHKLRQVSV